MKIIEVLKEIPLIDKKVSKNVDLIRQYSSDVQVGDEANLPFPTIQAQADEVASLLQSSYDLVKRKATLRRALALTNAMTNVTIEGATRSITEWIEYRQKGYDLLIGANHALTETNGQGKMGRTAFDPTKGIKTIKFYDQKTRDDEIRALENVKEKINAVLETVNATTDISEEYLK